MISPFVRVIVTVARSNLKNTVSHTSSLRLGNITRFFSTASLETQFRESVSNSKKLKDDPGNDSKLKLYALYKQSTEGTNTTKKPGAMDIVGKYKWNAWNQLGDMSKEEAMKEYIQEIERLKKEIGFNE